jgi:CD109 antigen
VDLRKETSFEKNITLDIPQNIVPDSEFIEIGAVGMFFVQNAYKFDFN